MNVVRPFHAPYCLGRFYRMAYTACKADRNSSKRDGPFWISLATEWPIWVILECAGRQFNFSHFGMGPGRALS